MSHVHAPVTRRLGALSAARSRVADLLGRVGKAAALSRLALAPPPAPAPPVDRAALVNYATFLAWERDRVCAELYPHLGVRAASFVLGQNAAERFFYPDGVGDHGSRSWRDVPPASTRAEAVLDLVGIDWRHDGANGGPERGMCRDLADNGERPAVPYGWPAIDAELVAAAEDLLRLDAAIDVLIQGSERDAEEVPGYIDLDDARGSPLATLSDRRAKSLRGLLAKARALVSPGLKDDRPSTLEVGRSLAWDLLGIDGRAVEPQLDPIFAAIDECRRLMKDGDDDALIAARDDLLQVVPETGAGCRALARFAVEFFEAEGRSLEDADGAVLALIARSPLR